MAVSVEELSDICEDSYVFQEQLSGRSIRELRELFDDTNPRKVASVRAFDDADIKGEVTIYKLRMAAGRVAREQGYKRAQDMIDDGHVDYGIGSAILEIAAFGEVIYA